MPGFVWDRISLILGLITLCSGPVLADREAGRDVFRENCIGCHSFECNRSGPRLGDLLGKAAGTISDFDGYSDAMKNSGIVWIKETLDAYLADPASVVPDNAMASFGRIDDDTERRNLINFLIEPDTSLDLCF